MRPATTFEWEVVGDVGGVDLGKDPDPGAKEFALEMSEGKRAQSLPSTEQELDVVAAKLSLIHI